MTATTDRVDYPNVEEAFFGRLLDMLTDPATARIFTEEDRRKVESRSKLPPWGMFLGAFQGACDDLRIPREHRDDLQAEFFEGA
jgi:hypothetical protein